MATRVKLLIALMLVLAVCSVRWAAAYPSHDWMRFAVYLVLVLLSSGMKVAMPKGEGTASVNFPLILLGVLQLSPGQAMAMAGLSVLAQCRIRVIKPFTLLQIAFNVANTMTATAVACIVFQHWTKAQAGLAPALSIAAGMYFLANTIPVSMAIGWSQGENPLRLWKREFPWYLPFYLVGAIVAAVVHVISLKLGWATSLLLIPVIYTIYRTYQSQMASNRARTRHLEETEALHLRTIEGLAMAIEAKDHNTHDHLVRVRIYVSEIGRTLKLNELEMQALLTAAFLHDIGKLAVPEHIINKPGKLTQEEFEKVKIHPIVGAEILERVRFPYPVVPIVRSHHEAWDGSGYPDGLKGEDIPIGARILTVVDCFDALASDRPYRKAMPIEQAMALVKSKAGIQFDPAIVGILEQRYVEWEEQARTPAGELAPLNTAIFVERGEAPGAGFQREHGDRGGDVPDERGDEGAGARQNSRTPDEVVRAIAEASHEAQTLFELSEMADGALNAHETSAMLSLRLRRLVAFEALAVYRKQGDALVPAYLDGFGASCFSDAAMPLGEGLSGWVAQAGRPILNGNPKVETNYRPARDGSKTLSAALSVPLFDVSGEIFGALTIYGERADCFSRDAMRILQAMEPKFALALQNALRRQDARDERKVQAATQPPNARQVFLSMEAELNRAQEAGGKCAVIVCDVHALAEGHESPGHAAGDLLPRAIADGLRRVCGPLDLVGRVGGEEFVLLLSGVDAQSCAARLEAIEQAVRKACRELKPGVNVPVRLGAAFFPNEGQRPEELLGLAGRRMHLKKRMAREAAEGSPERNLAARPIGMARSA